MEQPHTNTDEIFRRLRLGFALLMGFALGKWLQGEVGHHPSEFFAIGFGTGVVLTQALLHVIGKWRR